MSSLQQAEGDSLRRQLELARDYAAKNNLRLVEQEYWQDIGVSAFSGRHLISGKLGEFLQKAQSGEIERGSYLLVEAHDRLSREEPLKAALFVREIVNCGVKLVTLNDKKVYDNLRRIDQLIPMMLSQTLSYEESEKKRDRLNASWADRRRLAVEEPMTANCPYWLKLEKGKFIILRERREVVERIFAECIGGNGAYTIARSLNIDGIPTFSGRGKLWQESSVRGILLNRAVLGELQPYTGKGDEKVPAGNPLENYYPRIIDEATFYRAAKAIGVRRVRRGGRIGDEYAVLFKGLLYCAKCRGKIRIENKGRPPKGHRYI